MFFYFIHTEKKGFSTGLCLCRSLLSCFCLLAHLWSHLLLFQGGQILALLPFCFWQKVTCSLFTTVKYYRLCLWLDERWIFTVARFSYCLVSCVSRKNFRRAFFMCKSQYVWSKYILSYDPYGLAHTIVKADVCRTERVDMSKSWKSRPALHSHDFVVYVLGQSSTKMLISSSLLDKQIIIITS